MAETSEVTPLDGATPQELAEAIAELEQYRERLESDTLLMAQRAKVAKSQALASLKPQLDVIDAQLEALRQQHATLVDAQ